MKTIRFFLFLSLFLSSCASQSTSTPQIITAYSTPAAQPWMTELYTCAEKLNVAVNLTSDSPDISLRFGEPEILASPAYQIGEEEILIVTNRQSVVQNLTLEQAQALFAGQGDPSVQVWVYDSAADVQGVFDQLVMKGRSVTSFAKVAVSPQEMSDLLNASLNSVGILPRHWKAGDLREVYSAGKVPVLAVVKSEPQGVIKQVLTCLYNN
jgi:hypothetical protein